LIHEIKIDLGLKKYKEVP